VEGSFTHNQVPAIETCLRYSVEPDQIGLRCDGHAFSPGGLGSSVTLHKKIR
jgi:hypothetical protein